MIFYATVRPMGNARHQASASSTLTGPVTATGATVAEAVSKLEREIRYMLEWCPCSTTAADEIKIVVTPTV